VRLAGSWHAFRDLRPPRGEDVKLREELAAAEARVQMLTEAMEQDIEQQSQLVASHSKLMDESVQQRQRIRELEGAAEVGKRALDDAAAKIAELAAAKHSLPGTESATASAAARGEGVGVGDGGREPMDAAQMAANERAHLVLERLQEQVRPRAVVSSTYSSTVNCFPIPYSLRLPLLSTRFILWLSGSASNRGSTISEPSSVITVIRAHL